jgi:hypothetical protein
METKIKDTFTLPKEKIVVKFIKRNRGMAANVDKNHVISGGMLVNATKKFQAPLQKNGTIANVLTEAEKEHLEKITGLNLSVYGDFWKNHFVSLVKEDAGNLFDLSNPFDYLSYAVLRSLSKHDIAPSWADRNKNLTYQFAITREHEEMAESKQKYDSKKDAFKLYGKIEDNKDMLLGVLKLLTNKPISKDSKLDWLQNEVEKFVDQEPLKFTKLLKDSSLETKLLINDALEKKVIVKKANKYSTADGLDLCNAGEIATFENAIRYLEEPINQEVKTIIEAKVLKAK